MILVLGGCIIVLSLGVGAHLVDVGEVVARRARAQLAADAAALAAVAESGPWGRNLPEFEARRFAEANAGRLVDCLCEDGASAVQVTVEVEGIVARARAVYEATAMLPDAQATARQGLAPAMADAVGRLITAAGGRVYIVSGWRSPSEQEVLWREALHDYGSPEAADDWVARPGTSMHERGLAVDLDGDLDHALRLITQLRLPLHRPLPHEPWHFELQMGSP